MKPFDLEAAMRGEPIVTRDGRKAKFIAYVPEATDAHQVIAFIEGGVPETFSNKGVFHPLAGKTSLDLFMAPPMRSINGHEFPEPVREPLKEDQKYWLVDPADHPGVFYGTWGGDKCEFRWLERGLIQLTEEGARQQLKAMLAAVGGTA